jgi:poly-gamma-glutamate capsule biosynthesis protein CapA/YwtB (metallophosphatase superfamily)
MRLRILTAAFAAALLLSGCENSAERRGASSEASQADSGRAAESSSSISTVSVASTIPNDATVVLDFAGDCTLGDINDGENPMGFPAIYRISNSLTYPFDRVKSFFALDDLTVVNFEGTLTTAKAKGNKKWHFRGFASYAAILPASSVEVALVTNNHCPLDYLEQGYRDTVQNLTTAGEGIVEENKPFVKTLKGIETVVIGDSSVIGENTTETTGVAERVLNQIRKYKRADNIVVVDMHWGSEYQDVQQWQKTTARQFVDAGADLVVGQHPHLLNGIESYKGKYIVYSLGNFAFGGNRSCPDPKTCVFRAIFTSCGGVTSLKEAGVLPCYTTSIDIKNGNGLLQNNFQPTPVTGEKAQQVIDFILSNSSILPNGIKAIKLYGL